MLRKTIYPIVGICIFAQSMLAQISYPDSILFGEYKKAGFNMVETITLNRDSTYEHIDALIFCTDDAKLVDKTSGTFQSHSNFLTFYPKYCIKQEYEFSKIIYTDTILIQENRIDSLLFVIWNDHALLLSNKERSWPIGTNDVELFISMQEDGINRNNDINFYFYNKKCLECSNTYISVIAPKLYRAWIDRKGIYSNIIESFSISLNKVFNLTISFVKIEAGSKDGVYEGMLFYSNENDMLACPIRIFDVKNNYSVAYIYSKSSIDFDKEISVSTINPCIN